MKLVECGRKHHTTAFAGLPFPASITALFGEASSTTDTFMATSMSGTTIGYQNRGWGNPAFQITANSGGGSWAGAYLVYGLARDAAVGDEQEIVVPFKKSDLAPVSGAVPKLIVMLRGSGTAGSPTFYAAAVDIQVGSVEIIKVVAGVRTVLASSSGHTFLGTLADNLHNLLRFRVTDDDLAVKVWNFDCDNPPLEPATWTATAIDSSIASGAKRGWGIEKNGATADFYLRNVHFLSLAVWEAGHTPESAPVPLTATQRREYLEDSSNDAMVAIKISAVGDSTLSPGNPTSGYLLAATHDYVTGAGDDLPDASFEGLIQTVGDYTTRMNEVFKGEARAQLGNLILANDNGALDEWFQLNVDGQLLEMFVGAPTWPWWDFELFTKAVVKEFTAPTPAQLEVQISDASALAEVMLDQDVYVAGSGVPDDTVGKVKPLCYGRNFNVRPVCINTTTHQYQVHNGPITSIVIRENGAVVTGSATVSLSTGTFTFTAAPSGDITCDVVNTESVTLFGSQSIFPETLGDIARVLCYVHSPLPMENIAEGDFVGGIGNWATGVPYAGGIYINERRSLQDVLLEMLIGLDGSLAFNRKNELYLTQFNPGTRAAYGGGTAQFTVDEPDDLILNSFKPVLRILPAEVVTLIGRKNWFPQTNLAGTVSEANRALFQAEGTRSTYLPTYSGLAGNPQQHKLVRKAREQSCLLNAGSVAASRSDLNDVSTEMYERYRYGITVYETQLIRWAFEYYLGAKLDLVVPRYDFDDGGNGQIVAVSINPKTRINKVQWAVIDDELYPEVDPAQPVLGEEFYT